MAFLPDGRLLLTERSSGRIREVRGGQVQAAPWATIQVFDGGEYAEQGLLGIAIDPGFLLNRFVYVFYTDPNGVENRIARLQEVNGVGANLTVLTPNDAIPSFTYHNAGAMVFGVDGTLFVATGDRLVPANAQDATTWCGKVLRFEVPNLTVPASNPIPGSPIWSLGHRNQFGLTVHPVSGDLYQTENGGGLMDELNRVVAGGNYGWPTIEGREATPNGAFVDPLAWYQPTIAPTGTCFYSGRNYPDLFQNVWFFTDYNWGAVRALALDAAGQSVVAEVVFDDHPGAGYAVTMGPDGNLWFLTNDNVGYGADELGRYVHAGEPLPSLNVMSVSNKTLGGSITVCVHGEDGGAAIAWMSLAVLPVGIPTGFGDAWVLPDVQSPVIWINGDDRGYHAWSVPYDPTLLSLTIHLQGLALSPAGGLALTNRAELLVRG